MIKPILVFGAGVILTVSVFAAFTNNKYAAERAVASPVLVSTPFYLKPTSTPTIMPKAVKQAVATPQPTVQPTPQVTPKAVLVPDAIKNWQEETECQNKAYGQFYASDQSNSSKLLLDQQLQFCSILPQNYITVYETP